MRNGQVDANLRSLLMGVAAVASIALGAGIAWVLGGGCEAFTTALADKPVPQTDDPVMIFQAPDRLPNGAVKICTRR